MAKIFPAEITVSITDTDLFKGIVSLLKELSDKDDSIMPRLTEIMNKHDTRYQYTICEECQPDKIPLCTKECQDVCPMVCGNG